MKFAFLAAAAMAMLAPASAQAAVVTFNGVCATVATQTQAGCSLDSKGGTLVNGTYGNSATIAGTNDATLVMKVTAWQSNQTNGIITSAFLGTYGGGFGVTGVQDSSGGGNLHQIDNANGYTDFVMLQFSREVHLEGINLNLYQMSGVNGMDSDASIYNAASLTPTVWNNKIDVTKLGTQVVNGAYVAGSYNAANQYELAGTNAAGTRSNKTTDLSLDTTSKVQYGTLFSKVWLVGASSVAAQGYNDGFKLAQIMVTSASPAVPEPATWAMMIAGFGLVGASLRRRRSAEAPLAA